LAKEKDRGFKPSSLRRYRKTDNFTLAHKESRPPSGILSGIACDKRNKDLSRSGTGHGYDATAKIRSMSRKQKRRGTWPRRCC